MADDRVFLELRVHGVNNTKPEAMLGLELDDAEKVAGDRLGSFWRPTGSGRSKSGIRDDVEREAYSWGEMARTSLGGNSSISRAVGAASRAGWALLLPFGLVNVAYWTRRVDDGPDAPQASPSGLWARVATRSGHGAATLRIAGLLITLLMAATASVIALDLVAVQCFIGSTKVCTALPSFVDFLIGVGQARRLAIMSLVPVGLIAALLALSAMTRVRYEQPESTLPMPDRSLSSSERTTPVRTEVEAATATYDWPLLAVKGFWSHRKITGVTARLHVAATAVMVSMATAVHILFGFGGSCEAWNSAASRGVRSVDFLAQCWPQAQHSPRASQELTVLACGIGVTILILVSLVRSSDYAVDVRVASRPAPSTRAEGSFWMDTFPLIAALVLFAGQALTLASLDNTREPSVRYLLGTSAAPTIILTVLTAIGLSALLWRLSDAAGRPHVPHVVMMTSVALVLWITLEHDAYRRMVATILVIAVLGAVATARQRFIRAGRGRPRATAWSGSGPGIFLLLAALLAMLLSSAVATATGNWLNGSNSAASLADSVNPVAAQSVLCQYTCSTQLQPPNLEVPLPYMWFGAVCLPVLLVVLGGAAVAVTKSFTWDGGDRDADLRPSVLQKRRFAAVAQRAEGYVMLLVIAGSVGIIASIGLSIWGLRPVYRSDSDYPWTVDAQQIGLDIGMVALAGAGIGFLALAAGGGVVGGARPLGLAWDLMCFLPRAGHPLAPPCYAERAVPELTERCLVWLSTREIDPQIGGDRRVLLSAHSLGSVLAVAVVLSPRIEDKSPISLLTYGSQLRAYFSRIFPELLGPEVLGIQDCLPSNMLTPDPWRNEIDTHADEFECVRVNERLVFRPKGARWESDGVPVHDESVMGRLTIGVRPRWRSLWRRTDYLGFPVMGYPSNPIDRRAEEVVRVDYLAEIQTHGNYPKTSSYWTAFVDLLSAGSSGDQDGEA